MGAGVEVVVAGGGGGSIAIGCLQIKLTDSTPNKGLTEFWLPVESIPSAYAEIE